MNRILCRILIGLLLPLLVTALPAAAQDDTAIEANTPLTVELGSTVLNFVYSVDSPQTVDILARSVNNDVDTFLELYAPSGDLIQSNDDALSPPAGANALDAMIAGAVLSEAGDYQIRLSSFSGVAGGVVELSVSAQGQTPIGPVTGKQLLVGEPLKIRLLGDGPVDLVYVVEEPQIINLYANSLPEIGDLDTTLEVLSPSGGSVAFNDDLNGGDAGIENLALFDSGVYVVRLNTFTAGERGGVELVLEVSDESPTPAGELETFDTVVTLDGQNPAEFTFNGSAGQRVTISAEALNSDELDVYLNLFGPDGEQVVTDDDSGAFLGLGSTDAAIISFSLPSSGEYRLQVYSWFDTPGDVNVILTPG